VSCDAGRDVTALLRERRRCDVTAVLIMLGVPSRLCQCWHRTWCNFVDIDAGHDVTVVLTYTLARRDIAALSISAHEATLELCCSDMGLHIIAVQMKTVQKLWYLLGNLGHKTHFESTGVHATLEIW